MPPDPTELLSAIGIATPLVGFYDPPDETPFEPLVAQRPGGHACVFAFYRKWVEGATLRITRDNPGCGGAGYWLWGVEGRSREAFVEFLVDEEGLKASHALMNEWLDHARPYCPEHASLLIGPLRGDLYTWLRTVTFFVNPDQLSMLVIGANYDAAPGDPPAVVAPFGSGCMELAPLFDDLESPQAIIGSTDVAMRQFLPPDVLAFTVTKPMYERLCALDERSFLYKPFWQTLLKARGSARA